MNNVYVLYDAGTCEVIRVYPNMSKAMTAAVNRLLIFQHICLGVYYDEEYAVIEYRDHENGEKYALLIEQAAMDKDE